MSMKLPRRLARLAAIPVLLVSCVAIIAAASPAASAAPLAATSAQDGWVRIAHLSPQAPAMDIYLYPFGDPAHPTVLRDVSYGDVSAYMTLAPVSTRWRCAASTRPRPAIRRWSRASWWAPRRRTRLPRSAPTLACASWCSQDQTTAPKGQALVRVVQASLKDDHVYGQLWSTVLATQLAFGSATPYAAVAAGAHPVKLTASGDDAATTSLPLTVDTVHTIVVLDSSVRADDR